MMNLRLHHIRYKNIRDIQKLKITFLSEEDEIYKNSIIQMPNGTGKTTTMKLIRLTLNGTGENIPEDLVKSFKPLFSTNENTGEFELKLEIENEIYYITMYLNYDEGRIRYTTSKTQMRDGGESPGHNLGSEAEAILTENFVRLFVFDGEVAADIKDIRKNEAENAIKTLFFLDTLESLKYRIDENVKNRQESAQNSGVKTGQGIKSLRTKIKNAENIKSSLIQMHHSLNENVSKNEEEIEKIKIEMEDMGKQDTTLKTKIRETDDEIERLKNNLKSNAENILLKSRDPIDIHPKIKSRLESLANVMTEMRLPQTTSKEFFDLLVEQSRCICGRELNDNQREHIRKTSQNYLTEDEIGVINALKQTLRNIPEDVDSIQEYIKKSFQINRRIKEEETKYDKFVAQRNEGINEYELNSLENRKKSAEQQIKNDKSALKILTEKNEKECELFGTTWKENLTLCQKHLDNLNKKLQEATGTVEFSRKANLLKKMISDIVQKSLEYLKEEIKNRTNKKIERLLNQDDIMIEDISNSILLKSRGDVSEGQKLSIAYSFLSSLFEQSSHTLPFIVDSPAISIDLSVRREVSEIIPPLFDQFIVFVISSERKNFAETFYDNDNSQLLTIFKDDMVKGKVHKNSSQKFFDEFQSEENGG